MLAPRIYSFKKLVAQFLLLGLPTLLLAGYAFELANRYLALLQNNWIQQTLFFAGGMIAAFGMFSRRYRFIPITLVLIGILVAIGRVVSSGKLGEFDAFFWSVKYNTAAVFGFAGWIVGYGFSRARFFSIAWSVFLLAAMAVVIASLSVVKTQTIIIAFAPMLLYTFYIIYTSELLRNLNEDDPTLFWQITKRLLGFIIIMLLIIVGLMKYYQPQFEIIEREWGAGKPQENNNPDNSLTRNDGSGTTTNQNMGLSGFNNKANKDSVLFVAKLDNFFPDGKTPNPLYFTTDYYSKFDSETQTFEVDSLRPYNDLFSPDVSKVPLFFTKQDTSVLSKAMSNKHRRVASVEVYKHSLSARLFTAPTTAFFVQPISVPDENKNIYRSAYRAKMMVSDLNSAYFVYNPAGDQGLEMFQEQRFEVLRNSKGYETVPLNFYAYYTAMPHGNDYDSIRSLSQQIVKEAGAVSAVDKVVAIRDYFLRKDENGQPTFKYSDNPGIPGMPSANKLTYFLFDNKKGYCAYYAGATLFMLRSLGIPSRVATGFLTVDRSSKNPGWYWFYEDQAHAWVQVYFPEYGWIDFDTTVPDAEQQQAPQPDQTPPLASQTAWLVANGKMLSVDTVKKVASMQLEKMLYWDQPYEMKPTQPLLMDVSLAKVLHDTGAVSIHALKAGDNIVAISYSTTFKDLPPLEMDSALSLYKKFPQPAPIDEIKIMLTDEEKAALEPKQEIETPTDWQQVFLNVLLIAGIVLLVLFSMPYIIYRWLRLRAGGAGNNSQKQYWRYMATMFYLNQMGIERNSQTPMQYARLTVDKQFGTRMESFVQLYLKLKYSKQPLSEQEQKITDQFYPAVFATVSSQLKTGYKISHFLNIKRTAQFFSKPSLYA
ncbi:MAG TPA: transglutaminase domain-containing protein [Phnomibacter sp.]|nr:transglutaminase domain-containing protein [Phnomibacter sp.]